jgi:hypothetical protein
LDVATGVAISGYGAADSLIFTARNETGVVWSWGKRAMGALKGQRVRFGVELSGGAQLYSLRGHFSQ